MTYLERDDWTGDTHSGNDEVHYRLYVGRDGKPTTICVQWFDYFDYDARLILSPDAWPTEAEAEQALVRILPAINGTRAGLGDSVAEDMRNRLIAAAGRAASEAWADQR